MQTEYSVRLVLSGLLLLCVTLIGCRMTEEAKAQRAADTFFHTASADNDAAFKATLTQQAQQNVSRDKDTQQSVTRRFKGEYTLDRTVVTDNTAQAFFTLKEEQGHDVKGHLNLRREADAWRVYGIALNVMPYGKEVTLDFENPAFLFADMFRQLPGVMAEGMKALGEGFKTMGEGFKSAGEEIKREAEKTRTHP